MAYKACFACELLFEVDPGLGDSTRCPQCRGVLSDYDPDTDELDARAAEADLGQAATQANQAIVRTMSYKGLASAVREKIDARGAGAEPALAPIARPVPRAAPMPRGLNPTGANRAVSAAPGAITSTRSRIPSLVRPRGLEGLGSRPATAPLGSAESTQIDTPQIPEQRAEEDTPTPPPAPPVVPRPAPAIARPAPIATPIAPRAVPQAIPRPGPASVEVPRPIAVPTPAAAPPLEAPGRARTKVLDAVDIDAAATDIAEAPDESMLEDISMQSMHEDPARFDEPANEPADDPSMLDDISMQSVYEPIPDASEPPAPAAAPEEDAGYVLPATVALQMDPNRPLPPIPGREPAGLLPATTAPAEPAPPRPEPPSPAMPRPVAAAPRPAPQPIGAPTPIRPAAPAPIQPAAPTPIQPAPRPAPMRASPFPAQPMARPMTAPADDEISSGADAFMAPPLDMDAARGRSKAPLIIVLVVLLLGGGGFAAWWFLLRGPSDDAATIAEETAPPPPVLSWSEKLEKQIADGQGTLPAVAAAAPLEEATWIAGGPEGMATSLGLVTGMPSTVIREGAIVSDDDGAYIPAVQQKLAEGAPAADSRLLIGLPADLRVADLRPMADAGRRAGHGAFGLIVDQSGSPGQLGVLPFLLDKKGASLPEKGAVVVRVGTLGLHVSARDAANASISEGEPQVPRAGEALDLDAFTERLAALREAHPDIERVVIHPSPDMKLAEFAPLLSKVYLGKGGKRFAEVAIAQ